MGFRKVQLMIEKYGFNLFYYDNRNKGEEDMLHRGKWCSRFFTQSNTFNQKIPQININNELYDNSI